MVLSFRDGGLYCNTLHCTSQHSCKYSTHTRTPARTHTMISGTSGPQRAYTTMELRYLATWLQCSAIRVKQDSRLVIITMVNCFHSKVEVHFFMSLNQQACVVSEQS
jgi:hypothetical protein